MKIIDLNYGQINKKNQGLLSARQRLMWQADQGLSTRVAAHGCVQRSQSLQSHNRAPRPKQHLAKFMECSSGSCP